MQMLYLNSIWKFLAVFTNKRCVALFLQPAEKLYYSIYILKTYMKISFIKHNFK